MKPDELDRLVNEKALIIREINIILHKPRPFSDHDRMRLDYLSDRCCEIDYLRRHYAYKLNFA